MREVQMDEVYRTMGQLAGITGIPLSLLDETGALLKSWPETGEEITLLPGRNEEIQDFRRRKRDVTHPLISFIEPGFLLGMIELEDGHFILIGLVSPFRHSHEDILKLISEAIHPAHLQQYCDQLLRQPLFPLEKLKDMISLVTRLLGNEVPPENILFVDHVAETKLGTSMLDQSMFEQRETAEYHVPMEFEDALSAAVEAGDRILLERSLFTPHHGAIGRMSAIDLRQQKYSFICLITLITRAAIHGGLEPEAAYSLSDLYCQRMDLLTDVSKIESLMFTMLMDFCGKVHEIKKQPTASPLVRTCLDYISVHLHEPISLDQLSGHCGICGRSLSIRFRQELGISITDYIHSQKIREAEYLLSKTDYSLSEITSFLNYPTQSYFTQIFRKQNRSHPSSTGRNGSAACEPDCSAASVSGKQRRMTAAVYIIFIQMVHRSLPKKNSPSMPGPTWEPENGSWGEISTGTSGVISRIIFFSFSASSMQSPLEI